MKFLWSGIFYVWNVPSGMGTSRCGPRRPPDKWSLVMKTRGCNLKIRRINQGPRTPRTQFAVQIAPSCHCETREPEYEGTYHVEILQRDAGKNVAKLSRVKYRSKILSCWIRLHFTSGKYLITKKINLAKFNHQTIRLFEDDHFVLETRVQCTRNT